MTYKKSEEYTNKTEYSITLTHEQIKRLLQVFEDADNPCCGDIEDILLNAKEKTK